MKELHETKNKMQEIDLAVEERLLNEMEIVERRTGFRRIAELERMTVSDIKQQEKIKWFIDGDENSAVFHDLVNNKKRRNKISGLVIDRVWVTQHEIIKSEIYSFYPKKFQERWPSRPKFISRNFSSIDPTTRENLEIPFTV